MNHKQPEFLYDKIFVARHPIFTRDMQIWGYELLFRHADNVQVAVISDGDQATTEVLADGFNLAVQGMRKGAKALINFPRKAIINMDPCLLPPEQCVVEILETVHPESEVLQALQALKKKGYTLALDDFVGDAGFEPLCEIADIIKVDILHKKPSEVLNIVNGLAKHTSLLLAEKVESREEFLVCKQMGFEYFQGFFFNRPEIIPGRKLSATQATKVRLLRELSDSCAEPSRLVDIIQTDLSISYRLLRYINSAFFGLQVKIDSIHRAVSMLGCKNLRQWLQIVILSDVNGTDKAQELVRMSAHRARFLQLLAEHHATPFDQDGMFLLGFFSLLDAILDQPMEQVLEEIPLDLAIESALVDPSSKDAVWIELLDELDRYNWDRLMKKTAELGLPFSLVSRLSAEASIWTNDVMSERA